MKPLCRIIKFNENYGIESWFNIPSNMASHPGAAIEDDNSDL